jgi:hypothetical protein
VTQLHVTVDIFSGRRNPSMLLDDEQSAKIIPGLRPDVPLARDESLSVPAILGYRGLIFEQRGTEDPSIPSAFRLARGRLYGSGLRHWASDRQIERSLLTDGGIIAEAIEDPVVREVIETELEREHPPTDRAQTEAPDRAPTLQPCDSASPIADFEWWNDADPCASLCTGSTGTWSCQCNNNCYNYATNIRTDTFAVPGEGSGRPIPTTSLYCKSLRLAAFYDNLQDAPYADNKCIPGRTLVAAAINPGVDFHWYRKNQDGYWSHKPGHTQATNLDASRQLITDPRTCDRGFYTEFCGFMVVTAGHPRIS